MKLKLKAHRYKLISLGCFFIISCAVIKKNISKPSVSFAYAGKELRSHQKVWWKVRTWDQDGLAPACSSVQD